METDIINTNNNPTAGDIVVRRKLDTVQIVRHPDPIYFTMTAEDAIRLSHEILHHADIILKSTADG